MSGKPIKAMDARSFYDWLRTKNPGETFIYASNYKCCYAQYLWEEHEMKAWVGTRKFTPVLVDHQPRWLNDANFTWYDIPTNVVKALAFSSGTFGGVLANMTYILREDGVLI